MARSLDTLHVLLIQARNTLEIEAQEQVCFAERSRIAPSQFIPVNVVHDPVHTGLLDGVDALMIGGAGEYSALDDFPWMRDLHELVQVAYDRDVPTFGSCWGHQVMACAFGGTVIYDKAYAEFGCGNIQLTPEAADDPLFQALPPRFRANLGHHDRVTVLPPGAVELAFNETQRNQAYRMGTKPIYGTQFHSELDARRERERLIAYREFYREELGGDDAFQKVLNSLADTTEADHLLYDFLRLYVVGQQPTPSV